ncbi:MAG: hypothetical protein SWE60_16550, partial [Thermodesulfobacteriota bacterium]|nr:hypothetical protein [Thermodesulfobacteriota bacterium]
MKRPILTSISLAIITITALPGAVVHAEYHHVDDCIVCHYAGTEHRACTDSPNLMYVRNMIEHPQGSDPRETVFGPYVTAEVPYNGICEICHTSPNVAY